jgi:hypothetical protein
VQAEALEHAVTPIAEIAPAEPVPHVEPPEVAQPAPPVVPLAQAVAFHAVSEHEDTEAHRPVRRRRQHDEAQAAQTTAPLQLVETSGQVEAPIAEDELPRRTKPRRRREGSVPSEPLILVETQTPSDAPPPQ